MKSGSTSGKGPFICYVILFEPPMSSTDTFSNTLLLKLSKNPCKLQNGFSIESLPTSKSYKVIAE